jgi:hypothetical protein
MTKFARHCSFALFSFAAAFAAEAAFAQQQSYPPPGVTVSAREQSCQRLEAQLAGIDRSGGDAAKAEQIRQLETTLGRQQAELDRATQQSRRQGCETSGFFQLFGGGGRSEQCGPLNNQVSQIRANISRVQNDLQRLQSAGANYERDGQRRAVIAALAQNDCGPQYRAQAAQSRNLFETLFGPGPGADQNTSIEGAGSGYRTVCVRTCDGYFFPISFSTSQDRFRDDEATCQRMCPASEVMLFSHRNPGEDMRQAVSANGGKLYTEMPNAFKYKTEWSNTCVCKQPNESWANAVKDDPATQTAIERNDIVSEERAKVLSAPRDAKGRPILPPAPKGAQKGAAPVAAPVAGQPAPPPADQPEGEKKPIRSVGPKFLSQ